MSQIELEVNIDFDEASKEWRKNKFHRGKGSFLYKCTYIHSNGKECNKPLEIYSTQIKYFTHTHTHWTKKAKESDMYCRQHAYITRNNKK